MLRYLKLQFVRFSGLGQIAKGGLLIECEALLDTWRRLTAWAWTGMGGCAYADCRGFFRVWIDGKG